MDIIRRRLLSCMSTVPLLAIVSQARAVLSTDSTISASECGDPDLPLETLVYQADASVILKTLGAFNPREKDFAKMLIDEANRFVGMNRKNNEEQITELLRMFKLPFLYRKEDVSDPSLIGTPVPFCASGIAFATARAYLKKWSITESTTTIRQAMAEIDHYHFLPSCSVLEMYYGARAKRRWDDANPQKILPKAGYLVIYSFKKEADHVGIVLEGCTIGNNAQLNTLEFNTSDKNNTNGGAVALRTRPYGPHVMGFIRTDLERDV